MQPKARFLAEFEAELPVWATMQERRAKAEARRVVRNNTKRVNDWLYDLGHNVYHDGVPLSDVNDTLEAYGFERLEPMLLCGAEGRIHESVGHNRWLTLTWYKMESGRYEVVAYVS